MAHWRERYELLQLEYESLLRRVSQLEAEATVRPPLARFAPQHGGLQPQFPREHQTVAESVAGPLLRLRDEYLAAAASIDSVINGLEGLAAGAFRETRTDAPVHPGVRTRRSPVGDDLGTEPRPRRPRRIQVDAKGGDFGEVLDFQERLAAIPGVESVSVNALDAERATLTVELKMDGEPATQP